MRSAVPESPTTDWPRVAAVAIVALALWAAEIAVVAGLRYEWDVRAFALFGRGFSAAQLVPGVPIAGPYGYDGQFYAVLATDPLLRRDETRRALDNPRYRSGRILLPAMAWAVTGGSRDVAPVAYVWLCWAGAVAGPLLAVGWAARDGRLSPWWGLALCLTPGCSMSVLRAVPDGAAAALVIGGLWAWSARRRAPAVGLLALAVLCRETSLVFIAGAALVEVTKGRWRDAVVLSVLPAVPWMVWRQWLGARSVGGEAALGHNFAAPFDGVWSWVEGWSKLPDWMRGPESMAMAGLLLLAAATAFHVVDRRRPTAAAGAVAAGLVLAAILSDMVWVEVRAWGRVLTVLPLLGVVVMADAVPRVRRLLAVGLVAFAVSGFQLGRIEWKAAVRAFARGEVVERSVVAADTAPRRP